LIAGAALAGDLGRPGRGIAERDIALIAGRRVSSLDPARSATAGVPKAGVFAEGAARVVAQTLVAKLRGRAPRGPHLGRGTCYIEFGRGRVGSVEIDFLSGPSRTVVFNPPSAALVAERERFGSSRRSRWFGR
jgi:hypothetical protein